MVLEPPTDLEPAELFLLLLQKPRPWQPTDVVDGGRVVALTATERVGIELAVKAMAPQAATTARARHEIATCLHDTAGPVFTSADEVGDLRLGELRQYAEAVRAGLRVCCPEYGFCNLMVWHQRLLIGARAISTIAGTVGRCVDEGTRHDQERPDRWFGVPLSEITDGQWMAYRAGRAYVAEQRKAETA